MEIDSYNQIRSGGSGFYEQKRGLTAVWGKEAVQFLDGMITNDMKTLEDGEQMLAAFPNAQGRLLAVVRVLRDSDRFLIETEDATREKVFQNLFRFSYAGDFIVEDVSEQFRYFEIFGSRDEPSLTAHPARDALRGDPGVGLLTRTEQSSPPYARSEVAAFHGTRGGSLGVFVLIAEADKFREQLVTEKANEIDDATYETLRIENGVPLYGVDMDETTIVPELGLEGLISYTKGCYIGQEIIARIHFRGHVAKQLTGLLSEPPALAGGLFRGAELLSAEGKNAGRITSVTFSPRLKKTIALGFIRYEFLADGTELNADGQAGTVTNLPFVH